MGCMFSLDVTSHMLLLGELLPLGNYSIQDWMNFQAKEWEDKVDEENQWCKLMLKWWRIWKFKNFRIFLNLLGKFYF